MTTPSRCRRALAASAALLSLGAGAFTALAASPAGAAGSNKLTVKAGEYTYEFSGKPKAGLTEVEFVNDGVETHMMGLVPLKKNVTVKQLTEALMSDEEDAGQELLRGSPDFAPQPGFLGPKHQMGTLLNLSAGRWGVFCFVPSAEDGAPHVAHGMVKTFDIASGKSSLKAPKDGVTEVTISDSGVTLPKGTLPRTGYVKVTNKGSEARNWNVAALAPGMTAKQADDYFSQVFEQGNQPAGDAPAVLAGGVQGLAPNASAYLVLDFDAGNYGYSAELSDAENDANPLLGEFTVK